MEQTEEAKGYLAPYFIGPKYRPDLCLTITMENHCYQLLLMEVVSNEDIDLTIAECERSLIHQLRVLRNRELEVTEVTGFVIPTTKFSCPIFEVTVKWIKEDVRFKSSLKLLTKEQFVSRLLDVGKLQETMIKKLHRNDEHRFFSSY